MVQVKTSARGQCRVSIVQRTLTHPLFSRSAGLAMNNDPSHLVPLLYKMPWDAVNIGNHELYHNEVIDFMLQPGGFVEWWGSRMLSSNIARGDTLEPVGNNYRLLHGRNSSVLAFGFLYNMDDAGDHVTVKTIESVVQERWFGSALKDNTYDAIMVLAHMGSQDDLVDFLLSKIRQVVGSEMPIQFITGHTHRREYSLRDNASASFEAGRYLDTLGFASFPTKSTLLSVSIDNRTDYFKHTFIDAGVDVLKGTLGVETLYTEDGEELSRFIKRTQKELGLDDKVGCVQGSYYVNRSMEEPDSLWKFFADNVVPAYFGERDVVLLPSGNWRYDLLGGDLVIDDLIAVSPFNESFVSFQGVDAEIVGIVNRTMNQEPKGNLPMLPAYLLIPAVQPFQRKNFSCNFIVPDWMQSEVQDQLAIANATGIESAPLKMTSTNIWIEFFRGRRGCFRSRGYRGHTNGSHTGSNPFGFDIGISVPSDQVDRVRIGLGVAAVLVVMALAAVSIRQRGVIFQGRVAEQHRVTMEALNEFQEDEEGEFV